MAPGYDTVEKALRFIKYSRFYKDASLETQYQLAYIF